MLTEITIYCRGGQGGVTAARIIATAAMLQGYYSQAMPQFGPERRGARVNSYLRISDMPIRRRSAIKKPDVAVIFDTKIKVESDAELFILNSAEPVKLGSKTCYVDATQIAEKYGLVHAGWAILSAPMSGAIARALNIKISALKEAFYHELEEKAERSFKAAKEAYEVVEWS